MLETIWNLFVNNKEWLFSGVGVTVLLALGGLCWRFFPSKASRIRQAGEVSKPTLEETPSVIATKSIQAAMPLTRILFIDDDTKFKVVSILKTAGWQHTN